MACRQGKIQIMYRVLPSQIQGKAVHSGGKFDSPPQKNSELDIATRAVSIPD